MIWRQSNEPVFFFFALLSFLLPQAASAQLGANCQPPNLMVILDASNSMGNNNKIASQTCTNKASCAPMPYTHQPAPGTTPRYDYSCNANNRCMYTRWDIARNALKEVVYQYGGTAPNYPDTKARFGLTAFSSQATVEAQIVSTPPQVAARLDARTLSSGTHYMRAFTAARDHLQQVVNNDATKRRPTHMLFLTDGAPTDNCNDAPNLVRDMFQGTGTYALKDNQGNTYNVKTYILGFGSGLGASAQNCLSKMAQLGGTQRCDPTIAGCVSYYFADNAAQLKDAMDAIINNATQEVCDGLDNDCNGLIDETFPNLGQPCNVGVGECRRSGVFVCRPNGTGTRCGETAGAPSPEICDGKDNDCDGKIDEDFPTLGQPCKAGVGGCENTGVLACRADGLSTSCNATPLPPKPEICDGLDNDCNGQIDDGLVQTCSSSCGTGVEFCQAGQWVGCTAPKPDVEVCDGKDNDCDGTVDEGLKRPCSTICGAGEETCVNGNWVFCNAPQPAAEICDGKDNDCDGKIDEGLTTRPCQGDCGQGTAQCVNGAWTGCDGPTPETEICDGKDNDCNGLIDDGLERSCTTACGDGKESCQNGAWAACTAPKPAPEICDGVDNDCNGKIDDEATCPASESCVEGMCRRPCRNSECPAGAQCRNGFCFSITCDNVTCPGDRVCRSGQCVDACLGVTCPSGEVCKAGDCVENNCYGLGCPNGEICKSGQCIADPCKNVNCSQGQFCRDGACVSLCRTETCAPGEACRDGQCSPDPCAGVQCANFQRCVEGACQADPCFEVQCPSGRICRDGRCQDDPCLGITCPDTFSCKDGVCQQPPPPFERPPEEVDSEGVEEADASPEIANEAIQTDDSITEKQSGDDIQQPDRYGGGQSPGCGCDAAPAPFTVWFFILLGWVVLRRAANRGQS